MSYLLPFPKSIRRSQDFGANPGWGPNPPGGHNGDDWATPVGTPVLAAGDGVVVFAGEFDDTYADNWGWNLHYGGLMVILNMDGAAGPYFEYGHNSKLLVKSGDRVVRAQVIALTGNTDGGTGVSTGPHCHVGCLPPNFDLSSPTYGRVNPRLYMTEYPDTIGSLSYAGETITPVEENDVGTVEGFTDKAMENLAVMVHTAVKEQLRDVVKSVAFQEQFSVAMLEKIAAQSGVTIDTDAVAADIRAKLAEQIGAK